MQFIGQKSVHSDWKWNQDTEIQIWNHAAGSHIVTLKIKKKKISLKSFGSNFLFTINTETDSCLKEGKTEVL